MTENIKFYSDIRIAMVSPLFPQVGGMAIQARLLADCLRHEGIEVLLLPDREMLSWIDKTPIIRTIHQYRQRLNRLEQIKHKIDGVILLSCCGGLNISLVAMPIVKWCEAHGIPVVLSHRGATTENELLQSRFTRRAFQYFSRICAAIHVSSPYLQRVLANFGIESTSVPIIIDIPNLPYRPRAPDLSGIVNTRTMRPCHGGPLLIRSFAQIHHDFPNARLTAAGHGSEFKQCLEIAQTLQIKDFINFPGTLSTPEIANLLYKGGLLLNTSTADNIPNALLEAFSAGIPVVSSAVGGIPDLIGNDERGFLAQGMEPSDFLNAVKRAVADPELTLQKVAAARKWVEEFSWPVLRPSYLQALIEPLLVRNKNSEQGR